MIGTLSIIFPTEMHRSACISRQLLGLGGEGSSNLNRFLKCGKVNINHHFTPRNTLMGTPCGLNCRALSTVERTF